MKEKIPEELRKEFEQAVLNADLDHWMVDNDRQFLDKIWDAVDKLFNQEVEKQIAESMPSEEVNQPIIQMYGWICPRCGAVHSPFELRCDCPPPVRTWISSGTGEWSVLDEKTEGGGK